MKDADALSGAIQLIGYASKTGAFAHLKPEAWARIEAIEQHLAAMASRPEAKPVKDKPCKGCKKKKG